MAALDGVRGKPPSPAWMPPPPSPRKKNRPERHVGKRENPPGTALIFHCASCHRELIFPLPRLAGRRFRAKADLLFPSTEMWGKRVCVLTEGMCARRNTHVWFSTLPQSLCKGQGSGGVVRALERGPEGSGVHTTSGTVGLCSRGKRCFTLNGKCQYCHILYCSESPRN